MKKLVKGLFFATVGLGVWATILYGVFYTFAHVAKFPY